MQSPPKNYALACWWLTFRVPVEYDATLWVEKAATQARMTYAQFSVCRLQWPKPWERMLAKRTVRLTFLRDRGHCPPDGWAPLPGDGRSRNVPQEAQKRQYSTFMKRIAAIGQ